MHLSTSVATLTSSRGSGCTTPSITCMTNYC